VLHHLMRCARAYGVTLEADFVPNDRNRLMMMTYRFAGFRPVTETRDGHPSTLRLDDSPIPCVPAGVKLLADPSDFARETLAAPAALAVHFAAHSAACPQACALIHRGQTWRYAELRSEVARIAQALTDAGVAPGDFVAVHLDRSPQLAATVLAIWSLAAAYSALPVDQPRERLAAMARTVHAKVLVVDGRARSIRPPCSAQVVIDLADVAAAAPDAGALLVPRRLPHRLAAAYCIHTSGSTGTPKGVVNTHEGVVNLMRAQRDCFGSLDDCRVLQAASFGFDAFVFDLTLAFGARGTLVIVDDDAIVGSALAREVTAHEVTHATLTPSVLAQTDLRRERSLRCVISAGERFLPLALDHLPVEARIHNAYGPTEAAVWSLVETVPHDWPRAMPPPLGRPISGVRVTADGAREGAGASGDLELSVSGPCLAWGYPADPVATALRFVPDPTGTPGSRRYLTGDRVSQLEDGRWCFEGRLDDQVKLNGVRVELREVERALEQHPEVAACCVVGHAEAGHVVRLFAAIVPRTAALPPATLAKETLDRARQGVPASWLPAMVEIVPTLPLTAHGKRDRAAIAQALDARWLERLTDERSTTATARSASLEVELMATLWREVLGVTNTTASDNFFALGGNSLKLIQLRRRITEVFGNAPSVAEMYEARTLSDLVAFVQRRSAASGTAP
jgi:amino acid adenylation domain-containing protein